MLNCVIKNKNGFTLLEALVAISILMVAVMAPITIVQKGLSSAVYSKSQMIASYLAQDALEYVINQRDFASINNNFNWASFLTAFSQCRNANSCQIDTITGAIAPYNSNSFLLQTIADHFYGYAVGGIATNFTRQIQITNPNNGNANEALVTVTVNWGGGNLVVKTLIYNY